MNRILQFIKRTASHLNTDSDAKLLSQKDFLCMFLFIYLFTLLAFYRLGNNYAPSTSYSTDTDNRDIVLDFGDYLDIGSISIFLGNLNTRHFSISAFNEVTGAWEICNGDTIAESVFAWNKIDVNYRLRYLGIVSTDDTAILNEMVVQSTDGSILTPINAEEYSALFDEQYMFPDDKTYLDSTMFDEVYHGRTAYEFIHGITAYETTHPHLGKILIALGILVFGMNPFGWRFMSVAFGIFIVPLMYLFAKRLFKSSFIATATTCLLVFDCMHYTLSRIATIDIFAAFFILLMYYYMYQYFTKDALYRSQQASRTDLFPPKNVALPLALSGISMALGIATKWTGVYAGFGLAVLFIWYTITHFPKKQVLRLFGFCCAFFVLVPLLVYVLCFIPVVGYEQYDNLIDKALQGTISMFDYHSNLEAEHYYSSPFYEWPFIWMPLLDANDTVNASKVSSVSCMGNPAIWWIGILCELYVFFRWIFKKDKKAGFLCIAYLAQYVPWMPISRITFIYHYFPAILFVILMMGYTMLHIKEHFSWGKRAITAYLLVAVLCFFLFYPVVSGFPVDKEYGLRLRWLKEWILVL
ncbi:phospholipid carrier-dependent glycosyltransferase [Parablautia muri]|uniref:Polyprenol-phosphate-mannose--protein mannosyltransferase n=1 Tax=Parablautia muri TaxID=2320879 RepID=A0A9X5BGJ3_9FIRM|nr:phospholipid carrier-dependent glycosyltransferase [Parablautia muri]NBJ93396.1 phospholipid carrier-dependent glycosyltransferase [Parablautia muri]